MLAWLCAAVVGCVLSYAGASKFTNWESWLASARAQGVWKVIAYVIPGIELLLGALLVVVPSVVEVLGLATVLLLIFTVYLGVRVATGSQIPCACFGSRVTTPPSWKDVSRNFGLILLLVISAALR